VIQILVKTVVHVEQPVHEFNMHVVVPEDLQAEIVKGVSRCAVELKMQKAEL
jgi:hypothetical protein